MNHPSLPVLYSFRRCPYAMRARLALSASQQPCELREILLRAKPAEMLAISPKGTVPVLLLPDGQVLEQSLDIMRWALSQHDPEQWLAPPLDTIQAMDDLVHACDGGFKFHLDRYKYPNRYDDVDPLEHRAEASRYLLTLEQRLLAHGFLFGPRFSFADAAIAPFVRQFSLVDPSWFNGQAWGALIRWLDHFITSPHFLRVMEKYDPWISGTEGIPFPPEKA